MSMLISNKNIVLNIYPDADAYWNNEEGLNRKWMVCSFLAGVDLSGWHSEEADAWTDAANRLKENSDT